MSAEQRFNLGRKRGPWVDVTVYFPRPRWARVLMHLLPIAWLWNRVGLSSTVSTTFEVNP